MARPRKLPDNETLQKILAAGHTYAVIGGWFGVTAQAVGDLANRWGLNVEPRRYSLRDYIPWKVPTEHHGAYHRRMLGLYGRQQMGRHDLSSREAGQVRLFVAKLDAAFDGRGGVVHYDPAHDLGPFIVVPRRPGVDIIGYARTPDR